MQVKTGSIEAVAYRSITEYSVHPPEPKSTGPVFFSNGVLVFLLIKVITTMTISIGKEVVVR